MREQFMKTAALRFRVKDEDGNMMDFQKLYDMVQAKPKKDKKLTKAVRNRMNKINKACK